jgi:hypothetical protein
MFDGAVAMCTDIHASRNSDALGDMPAVYAERDAFIFPGDHAHVQLGSGGRTWRN